MPQPYQNPYQNVARDDENQAWRNKFLLAGTLAGAAIGLATAYLMARTAAEKGRNGPPQITTSDAIRTAVGIIGTIRGIAALGDQ